jgi:nicotinate phosphoribosyltransferase
MDRLAEQIVWNKQYGVITTSGGQELYVTRKPPINPALNVDFYELTTLAMFLEAGKAEEITTFNALYRTNPFEGAYTLFLGLDQVVEFLMNLQFTGREIDRMRCKYKLPENVWEYLRAVEFGKNCKLEAPPEGSMLQPHLPLMQITAPLGTANIIETALLTLTGYDTLVCTKAARVDTQSPNPWIQMGTRGAPGIEAGHRSARAAYIGGPHCLGTSNVLTDMLYDVPALGTMHHCSVVVFETPMQSFRTAARVFKEDAVFIIDTGYYVDGVKDAMEASRLEGLKTFKGVRDDSGDLAAHSKVVRKLLDGNNFQNVKVMTSNELDEYKRAAMQAQGAKVNVDGVGRKVVAMPDSGFVYKPVQIQKSDGTPRYLIKISGNEEKITVPGAKTVMRYMKNGYYNGDIMFLQDEYIPSEGEIVAADRVKSFEFQKQQAGMGFKLLYKVLEDGICYYRYPSVNTLKEVVAMELKAMWPEMLRLINPAKYPVNLSPNLKEVQWALLQKNAIVKE